VEQTALELLDLTPRLQLSLTTRERPTYPHTLSLSVGVRWILE